VWSLLSLWLRNPPEDGFLFEELLLGSWAFNLGFNAFANKDANDGEGGGVGAGGIGGGAGVGNGG